MKKVDKYEFLRNCPYFLDNSCKTANWQANSKCWDCWKKKKYIIRDKSIDEIIENLKVEKEKKEHELKIIQENIIFYDAQR